MTEYSETQCAIQVVGPSEFIANDHRVIDLVGLRQVMLKAEACGVYFSDTKLLHQFNTHPRKSEIISGIDVKTLKEASNYRPGTESIAPGHEPVVHVVEVSERVTHLVVGDRLLVQADWKRLRTTKLNAASGYNFDGALEEYVVVDERCIVSPGREESLIHVSEGPSAAVIGLIEPQATVKGSYVWAERSHITDGGRFLVVGEGTTDSLAAEHTPTEIVRAEVVELDSPEDGSFDGIILSGVDPERIKKTALPLGMCGVICTVLSGERIDRKLGLSIGWIHYNSTHFYDTTNSDPAEGYAWVPTNGELREDDMRAFIGAAGPMGIMHTTRTVTSGVKDLSVIGTDPSDERLKNLKEVVGLSIEENRVSLEILNTLARPLEHGYIYVTHLVPVPLLVSQAVDMYAEGAILNAFTGIPVGILDDFDLQGIIGRKILMLDTSGSGVSDMHTVLEKIEEGIIDTTVSLWVVTGMAGFGDTIGSVIRRTLGGKIMAFPMFHDLGLTPVAGLAKRFPEVATKLNDGLWTKEAEEAPLASAE